MIDIIIPVALIELLTSIFNTIGFTRNEGAKLAVNEWEIDNEDNEPDINYTPGYSHYTFFVNCLFERNSFNEKFLLNSEFIKEMKQAFVLESAKPKVSEKNRIKLVLKLTQAVGKGAC